MLLIGIIGFASTIGVIDFTIKEVYYVILNHFFPNSFEVNATAEKVVWGIRLPRICLGILAGIGLGIAGAVMQGILRNPLASPYTLGVSSGAGFGAAVAITLGAGFVGGEYLIIGNAFWELLCLPRSFLFYQAKKVQHPNLCSLQE